MKSAYFDGKHFKGVNIPFDWDSDIGWDIYTGKDVSDNELYARVAAAYRAVQLNKFALQSLPFALVTKNGKDYDTSDDWKNKVGFLPNPKKLFGLWRVSLTMTNSAYGFMERRRGELSLRYVAPTTIDIDADATDGLKGFWRQTGTRRTYYPLESGIIKHIFALDYDTEVLPSANTEFKALMNAAGILYYADTFIQEYFKRGGIKPTMLLLKGVPDSDTRTKIEEYWDKFIRGWYRVQGKIFNAETMDVKAVGEGISDLKENSIYRQAAENIAMATGIPLSLLLSNSANLATAQQELTTWYDYSVAPWAEFMAEEMSENIWRQFGLRLEFRPEQTDPDQLEEMQRAQSFEIYSRVLQNTRHPKPNSAAAELVGLDMPASFDYAYLDEQREPEPVPPQLQQQPSPPQSSTDAEQEREPQPVRAFVPDPEQVKELNLWRDIARRNFRKRGELPQWQARTIPAGVADMITARLKAARTDDEIQSAFDLSQTDTKAPVYMASETALFALAEALNRAADVRATT